MYSQFSHYNSNIDNAHKLAMFFKYIFIILFTTLNRQKISKKENWSVGPK